MMDDDFDPNVPTCADCGHEYHDCPCLECTCLPYDTVARGGRCETCGGDL